MRMPAARPAKGSRSASSTAGSTRATRSSRASSRPTTSRATSPTSEPATTEPPTAPVSAWSDMEPSSRVSWRRTAARPPDAGAASASAVHGGRLRCRRGLGRVWRCGRDPRRHPRREPHDRTDPQPSGADPQHRVRSRGADRVGLRPAERPGDGGSMPVSAFRGTSRTSMPKRCANSFPTSSRPSRRPIPQLAHARSTSGRRATPTGEVNPDGSGVSATSVEVVAGLPVRIPELRGHSLAVVATDRQGRIAEFSNRCGIAKAFCLAAPGVDVTGPVAGLLLPRRHRGVLSLTQRVWDVVGRAVRHRRGRAARAALPQPARQRRDRRAPARDRRQDGRVRGLQTSTARVSSTSTSRPARWA